MANIKAKITPQNKILVTNYSINASNIVMSDLFDVFTSTKEDGSLLIYNESSERWEASRFIDNDNTVIDGGRY